MKINTYYGVEKRSGQPFTLRQDKFGLHEKSNQIDALTGGPNGVIWFKAEDVGVHLFETPEEAISTKRARMVQQMHNVQAMIAEFDRERLGWEVK